MGISFFHIAGLDAANKILVDFNSFKGNEQLEFWFGADWKDKATRVERTEAPGEMIDIQEVA